MDIVRQISKSLALGFSSLTHHNPEFWGPCNVIGDFSSITPLLHNKLVTFLFTFHHEGDSQRCGIIPLIARFMGPTWGLSGADRTKVGPMLAPWTLLSGRSPTFEARNGTLVKCMKGYLLEKLCSGWGSIRIHRSEVSIRWYIGIYGTIGGVPLMVTCGPGYLALEGREQEIQGPGDYRVVVHSHVTGDDADTEANTWKRKKKKNE